jgi:hypothetical protein
MSDHHHMCSDSIEFINLHCLLNYYWFSTNNGLPQSCGNGLYFDISFIPCYWVTGVLMMTAGVVHGLTTNSGQHCIDSDLQVFGLRCCSFQSCRAQGSRGGGASVEGVQFYWGVRGRHSHTGQTQSSTPKLNQACTHLIEVLDRRFSLYRFISFLILFFSSK